MGLIAPPAPALGLSALAQPLHQLVVRQIEIAASDADVVEVMVTEPVQLANRRIPSAFISQPASECVETAAYNGQGRQQRAAEVLQRMARGLFHLGLIDGKH